MARKKAPARRATNHAEFTGPDPDKDALARLAAQAGEANAKAGHNSSNEVTDEILLHHTVLLDDIENQIAKAKREIERLGGIKSTRKTAAKAAGCAVEGILEFLKTRKAHSTGNSDEIVAKHKTASRLLKLHDHPLYTQLGLYGVADNSDGTDAPPPATPSTAQPAKPAEPSAPEKTELEAQDMGYQAGFAAKPDHDNPFTPATPQWLAWRTFHEKGATARIEEFRA